MRRKRIVHFPHKNSCAAGSAARKARRFRPHYTQKETHPFVRTSHLRSPRLMANIPLHLSSCLRRVVPSSKKFSAGLRALRIIFVRSQARSTRQTAPSVVIQSPSFPSGFPPPRGIGDSPRIMHDIRRCDTRAYRGALTYFERRALLAEIPARGEEFGTRKLKPVSTR